MKPISGMKLFVWAEPYKVSYGSSMLIAVAADVETAKAIALSQVARQYAYGMYEKGNGPCTNDLGEPTRVVDLPCAEWHRWEE